MPDYDMMESFVTNLNEAMGNVVDTAVLKASLQKIISPPPEVADETVSSSMGSVH